MPKGGARSTSGPPPDPNALRRARPDDRNGWTTLPADGRQGVLPSWPLLSETLREQNLWRELWTRPQAVMWERNEQELEVAMLVRTLALAEDPAATTERHKLLRQYLESLGLTTQGMLRNRWRIAAVEAEDDAPAAGGETATAPTARTSARSRLTVVADGREG